MGTIFIIQKNSGHNYAFGLIDSPTYKYDYLWFEFWVCELNDLIDTINKLEYISINDCKELNIAFPYPDYGKMSVKDMKDEEEI